MSAQSEITGIQFLRGFAAIAVVIDHVSSMASFPKYFGRQLLGGALSSGGMGVDNFFVISGFIIVVVSLGGPQLQPRTNLRSFFRKRFVRIIPLMWLAIGLYALTRGLFTATPIEPWPYLRAVSLWPWGSVEPVTIWTLRHEMIFYALFALSYLGPWRSARWVLFGWFASPLLLSLLRGNVTLAVDPFGFVDIVASPVNLEFGAGFLLAMLWLKRGWACDWRLPTGTIGQFSAPLLYALGVLVFIIWNMAGLHWKSPLSSLTLAALNAALIFLACRLRVDEGRMTAVGRFLGNASYSIYLFHPGLCSGGLAISSRLFPAAPLGVAVAGISVFAVAACCILHLVLEKPFVTWLDSRISRPPPRWLICASS